MRKPQSLLWRLRRGAKSQYSSLKVIIAALVVIGNFLIVLASQGAVAISPKISELFISRGGWESVTLTVSNRGKEVITVKMYSTDMDMDEAGNALIVADETYDRGCSDWITFDPQNFTLAPDQSKPVKATIKAPTEVLGSYFANCICRQAAEYADMFKGKSSSGAMGIAMEAASLLLVTIKSSKNDAVIVPDTVRLEAGSSSLAGPLAATSIKENKGWKVEIPVFNKGNVYTQVGGEVAIYSEAGALLERALLQSGKGYIFPQRKRTFTATGTRSLGNGAYLVRSGLRTREGRFIGGPVAFTIVNGTVYAGTNSDKLHTLLEASTPPFTLSERMIELEVTPGSQRFKGVTVTNHSKETLTLIPHKLTWSMDAKGDIHLEPMTAGKKSSPRSCADWFSVDPDTIILAAGAKKTVKLSAKAPELVDGEYYAAIRFDNPKFDSNIPTDFLLPSTLFLSAVNKTSIRPQATLVSVTKQRATPKGCLVEVVIENQGNAHCVPMGQLEILDVDYKRVEDPLEFGGANEFLMPGQIKTYPVLWKGDLEPGGEYQAKVHVVYDVKLKGLTQLVPFKVEK